jgi:hypothetical protein
MIVRKRALVKALITIPILWIIVMFLVGMRDDNNSNNNSDEILKMNEEKRQLIVNAASQHEALKKLISDNKHDIQQEDHDHPEEERKKAKSQQNQNAGQIQIKQPIQRDDKAPGTFKFF